MTSHKSKRALNLPNEIRLESFLFMADCNGCLGAISALQETFLEASISIRAPHRLLGVVRLGLRGKRDTSQMQINTKKLTMASLFISMETTRYGLGSGSGSPVLPSLTWPGILLFL